MTAIILLILGIRLAVDCDDRNRAVIVLARFASYRYRLLPVSSPRHRRCSIRCLRCKENSRASEETADLSR
ncbi:MAG: hypothetical protein KJ703_00015 [Alphaproteobacteria bacterium]|nr:hypothetical protein [Alphaproteobacteria bacterium]